MSTRKRPAESYRIQSERQRFMNRFGIVSVHPERDMPAHVVEKIIACKDDSARRLILGIGEQLSAAEEGAA